MADIKTYLPTGNEYITLPTLRETDGAIESLNVVYEQYRGLLEFTGCENPVFPFLQPCLYINEKEIQPKPGELQWRRLENWIPQFIWKVGNIQLTGTYLTPIGERGLALRLDITCLSETEVPVFYGLKGSWQWLNHAINITKKMRVVRRVAPAAWGNTMMLEAARETSIVCLGLQSSPDLDTMSWGTQTYPDPISRQEGQPTLEFDYPNTTPFFWTLGKTYTLKPGETQTQDIFFGAAVDEVGAFTSALEMKRKSFDVCLENTVQFLKSHQLSLNKTQYSSIEGEARESLESRMNLNAWFCYFFALGRCLDTEHLALVTSRSPRYYVSAGYWDRDILYWAFPVILDMHPELAREILLRVFTTHNRNVGIHSQYLDGTVLEPGFELDELCAPVIALADYIDETRDDSLLELPEVWNGLEHILKVLNTKKHPEVDLYSTFLLPSDDPAMYPYVTYDNVLVWRTLTELSWIWHQYKEGDKGTLLKKQATAVKWAINTHCIVKQGETDIYAWAVDLKGNFQIYDDPPGSLQLMPFHEFCSKSDAVWKATIDYLHSTEYRYSFAGKPFAAIGCDHFPHPAVFSMVNMMLGNKAEEGLDLIVRSRMDDGIACESVNEETGALQTGAAFATLAGLLAHVLYISYDPKK